MGVCGVTESKHTYFPVLRVLRFLVAAGAAGLRFTAFAGAVLLAVLLAVLAVVGLAVFFVGVVSDSGTRFAFEIAAEATLLN